MPLGRDQHKYVEATPPRHQADRGTRTGGGHGDDFPWPQPQQPVQQLGWGTGTVAPTSGGDGWDNLFGQGTDGFGGVSAPTVRAPSVQAPSIPQTPEVTPGYYTDWLPTEQPTSELEELINQVLGREVADAPQMRVDEDYVNSIIQQFGIQPRSPEEIQEHAQAIVDRQRYSQEQIIQREIDRFEREFPNEFRRSEQQIRDAAANFSADKQEEMAARGTFYSSIMAQSMAEIDSETMEMINDIATSAASHVTGLRGEMRDLQQWSVLEEEVVRRQLEAEDRQQRERLAMMHIEVATWADQMALDAWYRQENLLLQQDQLQLQGIQLKQQEAERMGQHYATAMMADHPLVQGTLQSMGIPPEAYAQMPMEQQSYLVNNIIGYNEIEQQMRMREFQMRATIAEIQLQNASMQLQASIASGQFQMDAQRLNLQYMMHRDQMALGWAGHSLDERMAEWQISQPRGVGTAQLQQDIPEGVSWGAYNEGMGYAAQVAAGEIPAQMFNRYVSTLDPATQQALRSDAQAILSPPAPQEQGHARPQKQIDWSKFDPGTWDLRQDLDILGDFFGIGR